MLFLISYNTRNKIKLWGRRLVIVNKDLCDQGPIDHTTHAPKYGTVVTGEIGNQAKEVSMMLK